MSEEVSVQQSLFKESERIETVEAYRQIHKTAFRVAYNFLEAHFPPVNTDEYWKKTCDDAAYVSAQHITNELCQGLLGSILIYLSEFVKVESAV